ncbi:MAG: PAS domain S-box protein [Spirosoma sp.]|nr:PAS domain S-box protein [Spirosoma sp.]
MPTNFTDSPATSSANDLLEGILNASLNGIIAYESVRDATGTIVDFRAVLINRVAQQILHLPNTEPGWRLLTQFPDVLENDTLGHYIRVVNTGEPDRFEINGDNWYDVSAVKLHDGFVATFIDITSQKQTSTAINEQNKLLSSILNTSLSSILLYEAIRDEAGQIQDFQLMITSPRAETEIKHHFSATAHNRTLLTINPESRRMGQFDRYVDVVETGQSTRQEHFYANINVWYDTIITPSDNGVVITATDITAQKQAQQELEQQADLLRNMLTGILLLGPIRQDDGTVTDFQILTANRAAGTMTNTDSNTIVGQTMLAVFPTYKSLGFFDLYREVLEAGQPRRWESHYEDDKLNEWFEVLVVKQGGNLVLTYTKTTDARLAQQRLEASAANLQAVIDQSQTGIFVFSPVYDSQGMHTDFRFKTINQMVAALVGQTPDVLTGQVASDWFISYRETGLFDKYKRTLITGEDQRFDINYSVDGFDVWFDVHSVRFGNDVLVTFTDYTDLKRAQLAAEKQTSFLNNLLNSTSNGIMSFEAVRNEQGQIVDLLITNANSIGATIAGKPIEQLINKRALVNFPGIKTAGLYNLYVATIETKQSLEKELHYQADGLDTYVTVKTTRLGDGLVVTYNDVSETMRLATYAKQQASLLDSVLNCSINGIMAFESIRSGAGQIQDFRFLTSNEAACRMVGKSEVELVGQPLLSIFPGNVESGLFAKYIQTTETGESARAEIEYKADGLDFWLDISAQKLADGFVVTFTDISPIKRASQAIEQSAAELKTVIDTAQTGIFLIGPVRNETGEVIDFRLRVANRIVSAFAGRSASEIMVGLVSEWFPEYMTNGLFEKFLHTYLTGNAQHFEIYYEGKSPSAWLDMLVTKLDNEVLVTFSDFTTIKHLQQQLEASVIDLQRSNKNLEQFAYVASHDLQEPLRKIQQFGDILQTNYAAVLDESGQDMLRRMQSAAGRMRVLVKDVLAYSRIAIKRENEKAIDLNQLLRDVAGDLETAILEKNALILVDTLPIIAGDAAQLRQLFQNLMSNALKFTKPGRQPELQLRYTVQRGRDTGLPVSASDNAIQFYRFELSDNGIGFDPHQAEKIFQVFQRLHNRNEYQGTGIGLAIVQKVIDNHRGYIRAEGQPGHGATFTILIPV